ncbi:helix-turn-helix transcriptional regulator [Brevibacillus halotolerans]|uniref:helix-turn-helix transcriptional regulator n=1 Tax=Brevibacillus halotolerans TaxID=1507437 RepID=UPI0015EF5607|nr:helix-turn-helix transcriptional regulator [Brevibacillus halotolerans]MBA4535144.1 helix-turn-helix transcriptional regulator [Brevibacillus halotolerans]
MRHWMIKKRVELNFTQEQVANRADIARTTYAMIEQENRTPSVNVAKKIARVLGVEWTIFFEEKCHDTRHKKQKLA